MCHCLSFLVSPNVLQTWACWKRELLRLIERIQAYNGPFTGLTVHRVSISGSVTTYSPTGARVEVTVTMGGCMSTSSAKILSEKRKQQDNAPDPDPEVYIKQTRAAKSRKDANSGTVHNGKDGWTPKKISINGASNCACLFTQQGRKGLNQDAMIVWEDFNSQEDAVFCGVFDGHGPYGHLVAQLVRDLLPPKLACHWQSPSFDASKEQPQSETSERSAKRESSRDKETCHVDHMLSSNWKESFLNAYMLMDRELRGRPNLDCFCSGTTAVTLIKQGNDVFIGNVGDSRAILGTRCDDGTFIAVQLTVDLKPNLPEEAERIRQCRGRVFALQDEPEVHRVWLPHDNSPGLAMARAFGDFCLKNFGVIAVPQVTHRRLTPKDQFIVLATDGIWDVLSNEQVVQIVASVSARPLAAKAVVESAVREWRSKYPTSKVDDCAVVCLFTKDTLMVPSERKKQSSALSKLQKGSLSQNPKTADKPSETTPASMLKTECECPLSGQSHDSSCFVPKKVASIMEDTKHEKAEAAPLSVITSQTISDLDTDQACLEGPGEIAQNEDWTALDGVTRVNSLVNLPRFSTDDARAGG